MPQIGRHSDLLNIMLERGHVLNPHSPQYRPKAASATSSHAVPPPLTAEQLASLHNLSDILRGGPPGLPSQSDALPGGVADLYLYVFQILKIPDFSNSNAMLTRTSLLKRFIERQRAIRASPQRRTS